MALNTNIRNVTVDFGSRRALEAKQIAKALKDQGKTEQAALAKLERTIRSLPSPGIYTATVTGRIDWGKMFGTITLDAPQLRSWPARTNPDAPRTFSWPAPKRWRPELRNEQRVRMEINVGCESQYMQQRALPFPPIPSTVLFRIEHRDIPSMNNPKFGCGPYNGMGLEGLPYSETCPESGEDLTPGPWEDGELLPALNAHGRELTRECYFGFGSLEAMKSWFRNPKFWASLKPAGFVVRRYEGCVFHGRRQSVIDSTFAVTRLGEVEL